MQMHQTPNYSPTQKQKTYAYNLACQILDVQRPNSNIRKGYTEDQPRAMCHHFTVDQLKDALHRVRDGEKVEFIFS